MFRLHVAGLKGGTGKTTVAYYLARFLSDHHKVLLIDKTVDGTLSKSFGVEDSLFSCKGNPYITLPNTNITVLNASYLLTEAPNDINCIKNIYEDLVRKNNVIIVDHSQLSYDRFNELEIRLYYDIFRTLTYNVVLVVGINELEVLKSLNFYSSIDSYINKLVAETLGLPLDNLTFTTIWAVIINKVMGNVDEKYIVRSLGDKFRNAPKILIPFYKELLAGFHKVQIPQEFVSLGKYMDTIIHDPHSIVRR
ncbi:MAG: ParA family protein [Sulfolobaceae archaeon]|nr:ParA family protein [Sulfolobaceae archaeon]